MKPEKVAQYGLLTALALALSWVESLLPPLGVPGVKLGLPNLAIVFALYRLGFKDAWAISLARVVLVTLLFGNGAALAYSVAGGVAHNGGQILVAMALLETARLAWYLPVLWVSGTVAGVLIGIVAGVLVKRVPEIK